jgi:hypothetical protein
VISKIIFALSFGLVLAQFSELAIAASATKSVTAPEAAKVDTLATPLTSSECTDLGGKVGNVAVCNSKTACRFTDQNGVNHDVCIAKSQ